MSSSDNNPNQQFIRQGSHFLSLLAVSVMAISGLGCNALPNLPRHPLLLKPVELLLQSDTLNTEDISNNLAISPDDNLLVANGVTESLQLRHMHNGQKFLTLKDGNQDARVTAIAFSPDSKTLAGTVYNHQIILWDTQRGDVKQRLSGHRDWVRAIAFSPNGKLLASGSNDKTVKIWDVKTGQLQKTVQTLQSVEQVSFSSDATIVSSADITGIVQRWNVRSGQLIQKLANIQNNTLATGDHYSIGFSANGKLVARADADKTIEIWDLERGKLKVTLPGHNTVANVVGFSPNGLLLATAANSGERELLTGGNFHDLRLWDVRTGQLVAQSDNRQYIRSLVFAPNLKALITAGDGGKVRLWNLDEITLSP